MTSIPTDLAFCFRIVETDGPVCEENPPTNADCADAIPLTAATTFDTYGATTDGPSPRTDLAMAYDSIRNVVVLFGGTDLPVVNGDTWEWDGSAWSLRSVDGPAARFGHAMAFDEW